MQPLCRIQLTCPEHPVPLVEQLLKLQQRQVLDGGRGVDNVQDPVEKGQPGLHSTTHRPAGNAASETLYHLSLLELEFQTFQLCIKEG